MVGIFNQEETEISRLFESKFGNETNVFNGLLNVYSAFLRATSGKVKDTDYPSWTILLFLSQTLPLMENAIKLLALGYIRSSEILVRVAGEAILLSVYFKEFPETEIEYRNMNHREFFRKHKIKKMMKRVEREGKSFISNKPNKKIKWHKIIFTNLYGEACRFVHNDPEVIYLLAKDNFNENTQQHNLILGPQLYPDPVLSMGLRRLFNTLLFSLVVFGIALSVMPDDSERETMDEASRIIEELNAKP